MERCALPPVLSLLLSAALCALFVSAGCSSGRKATATRAPIAADSARIDSLRAALPDTATPVVSQGSAAPRTTTAGSVAPPTDPFALVNFYAPLYTPRLPWQTLSAKAKLSYQGPDESFDFSAHFRARRDSAVWVSISALGGLFNVARAMITPDSIVVVNHAFRTVSRLPMNEVARLVPVAFDFAILQDVLLGQPLSRAPHPTSVEDTVGAIRVWQSGTDSRQAVTVSKRDTSIRHLFVFLDGQQPVSAHIQHKAFETLPGGRFPVHRDLQIQEEGGARYHLEVVFTDPPEIDRKLEMPFPIPAKYDRR